jgi:hypothetical protein
VRLHHACLQDLSELRTAAMLTMRKCDEVSGATMPLTVTENSGDDPLNRGRLWPAADQGGKKKLSTKIIGNIFEDGA